MKKNNLKSSQQTSNYVDYSTHKNKGYSGYGWMFEEDLCRDFSIVLAKWGKDREFYRVDAETLKLKKLLEYDDYGFLEYKLDDLLSQNMNDLIYYGKAYVEVIRWYDEEDNLVRISFQPFHYKKQIAIGKNIYYQLRRQNGEKIRGKIRRKDTIAFSLKDLGYSVGSIKKVVKKLDKMEMADYTLALDKDSGFDANVFQQKCEYKLLKITRKFYWPGMDTSSKSMSEPYMLYRHMKFLLVQKRFLDYLMQGYNKALENLGKEYGFEGRISYQSKTEGYEEVIENLRNGEMNCEQVGKVVFEMIAKGQMN